MRRKFTFLFLFFISFSTISQAQFIEVENAESSGVSAEELAQQILQNNNFTVTNITFEGAPTAMGSFLASEISPIGINHGMVLTTGIVASSTSTGITGIASDFANSANESTAVSEDLMILDPSNANNDVANLIIEFIPNTDTLVVDFVFGSEEYPEYACTAFNDAFGLFLTGPGIAGPFSNGGENIARLPNTDTYISINTIHGDNGENCPPENEEYYINNVDAPISFDGFTTVIPIRYPVIPFETYTMTLSVADKGDNIFDSATFLQFSDCTSGFCNFFNPEKALIPENCEPANVYLDLSNVPEDVFPFEVSLSGNAGNGTDYETLPETFTLTAANPILDFDIVPIMDAEMEGIENIELSVSSNGTYVKSVFYYLKEELPLAAIAVNNCDEGVQISLSEPNSPIYEFTNNTTILISPVDILINSPIEVSGLPYSELFSPGLIKEVCIDVDHNWTDDVDIYLKSPSGQVLTLSTDNGANGNDYMNTCFSPTATNKITGDTENAPESFTPFTGTWKPEGLWSNLENASTNGTWTLQVKDDSNGFTGVILGWSITFHESILINESIVWSTGETGATIDYSGEFPVMITAELNNSTCNMPFSFEVDGTQAGVSLLEIEETTCDADYAILIDGYIFDLSNPVGEVVYEEGSYTGCDSIITVNLTFLEASDDVIMSEDYIAGETITVEGVVYDSPGFYTIPIENPDTGCSYNIEFAYLPSAPTYDYDVIDNEESTMFECGVGGDYCFNLQKYGSTDYELIIDGENIGSSNDYETCNTLSERRFDVPAEVYDMSRVWTITDVGGFPITDGLFQGMEGLLQHLHYADVNAEFFSITDISVPKIITRVFTTIETITILDVNDMTEIIIAGDLVDTETGVILPLMGTESQVSVYNTTTEETETFDLNVDITTETNDNMTYWDGIITYTVINTVNIEASADDLCGAPISATIACEDDEIIELNVELNEDGTATVTGTVLAVDFTDVFICVEFCDAFGNCDTDTYILLYDLLSGTEEINSLSEMISVFPNPAQNEFIIYSDDTENTINSFGIFTLNGQEVHQQKIDNQSVIDASDLAAGVYLLKIDTENGVARKRLVVTH